MELKLFCIQCQDTRTHCPTSFGSSPSLSGAVCRCDQPWKGAVTHTRLNLCYPTLWMITIECSFILWVSCPIAVTECWCLTPLFHQCFNASRKLLLPATHSWWPWGLHLRWCMHLNFLDYNEIAQHQNGWRGTSWGSSASELRAWTLSASCSITCSALMIEKNVTWGKAVSCYIS